MLATGMAFKWFTSDQMSLAVPWQVLSSRSMLWPTFFTYVVSMGRVKQTETSEMTEKATVE